MSTRSFARGERALDTAPFAGLQRLEPVEAERAPSSAAASVGVTHALQIVGVGRVDEQERAAERDREQRRAHRARRRRSGAGSPPPGAPGARATAAGRPRS